MSENIITWEDIKTEPDAIKVGNEGFVFMKSHYGSDDTICEAARISYGNGTKSVSDNRNLLRYLLRHHHTSPFEQSCATFVIKLPLFIMAQLVRHRTAKLNQYSGRYSVMPNEFYKPEEINTQATNNKQGSGESADESIQHEWMDGYDKCLDNCRNSYDFAINKGIAREQARMVLPQSQMTICVWQIDLHNAMHFLKLRMDKHAQKEIRDFANAICELLKKKFPVSMEAFEDYRLKSASFSRMEMDIIKNLLKNVDVNTLSFDGMGKREIAEFIDKIKN